MNAKTAKKRQNKAIKLNFYYKLHIRFLLNKTIKERIGDGYSTMSLKLHKGRHAHAVYDYAIDYLKSKGFDVLEEDKTGAIIGW